MKAKRYPAMLIILCMVLAMLPAGPLTARAAGTVEYNPAVLEHPVIPDAIAKNLDYIKDESDTTLINELNTISKMIQGLIKKVNSN